MRNGNEGGIGKGNRSGKQNGGGIGKRNGGGIGKGNAGEKRNGAEIGDGVLSDPEKRQHIGKTVKGPEKASGNWTSRCQDELLFEYFPLSHGRLSGTGGFVGVSGEHPLKFSPEILSRRSSLPISLLSSSGSAGEGNCQSRLGSVGLFLGV
jgi:hypothetical protein